MENNQPRISFFKQVSIYRPPSFLHRLLIYHPSTRNCYPVYQHFFSFSCKPFNRDNVAKLRGFASRNNDGSFYEQKPIIPTDDPISFRGNVFNVPKYIYTLCNNIEKVISYTHPSLFVSSEVRLNDNNDRRERSSWGEKRGGRGKKKRKSESGRKRNEENKNTLFASKITWLYTGYYSSEAERVQRPYCR